VASDDLAASLSSERAFLSMFSGVRAISFDCYGTLVDWQAGLLAAASCVLTRLHLEMEPAALFTAFATGERREERPPYRPYREVLRSVAAELFGPGATESDRDALWRSIGAWPVFSDTPGSLAKLKGRYALAVASNIDDDLFALTAPKLGVALDALVTAERVRSYKPGEAHFRELCAQLGLEPREILHVAESRYHDIEPASRMGFSTAWVDRGDGGASASGPGGGRPDVRVSSLAQLVDRMGL
jgi:2-haloacid dehalogenase